MVGMIALGARLRMAQPLVGRTAAASFQQRARLSATPIINAQGVTKEVLQAGSGAKPQPGQSVSSSIRLMAKTKPLL